MRFIIDAALPRSLTGLFVDAGHEAIHVRELGMHAAADPEIAAHAKRHRLTIVTADFDFADIRNYPPREYAGIVVFELPKQLNLAVIEAFTRRFLERIAGVESLTGQLAIVDEERLRVRQ